MAELILYGLIASVFSLIGGVIVLWRSQAVLKIMTPLISFAAAAFLAVSFLDLLPEAVEAVEEPHNVFIAALVGFFIFFALERLIMRHSHRHLDPGEVHREHTESLPPLIIIGDIFHNFLDGIAIALAFIINPAAGLTTAIAVAAHEVPQEIGDFAILLDQGWSKTRVFMVNLVVALSTIPGVLLGYYASAGFENLLPYLLAGTAGIFIYIAASDIIPEIHHRTGHKSSYRILFAFLLGLIVVGYLIFATHSE